MKCEPELVRRASQGDQAAFGKLAEDHWARLVRLARSVVGEAEAEDAVQDGLIRAWHKLPQLVDPAAFGAWLSRLVVRICLKRARSSSARFVALEELPEPRAIPRPNPGAGIDVVRLLASLPPRQRAVMYLTVVEGMADSEIGPMLGIAPGSVRAHRRRARERIERDSSLRSTA
jgi:RNA polymerase sigma-70 factor (ECF subfamily)